METRAGLEAALAAAWDRETLAVYADHLQAEGDPRGELIVLDLQLEQRSTPELVARRASLMTAWLGRLVPSDPHRPWIGDSFRLGFVEDLVIDDRDPDAGERLATMLASPLAPYLKRVTVRGDALHVDRVMTALAEHPHAWMTQLGLRSWSAQPVGDETLSAFIAATPRLAHLDVQGAGVLAAFAHPAVRTVRVTGWTALPAIYAGDDGDRSPTLTGVTDLDLAFAEPYDGAYRAPQPPVKIGALLLPALRRLDLSRNEPEQMNLRDDDDFDVDDEPEAPAPDVTALSFLRTLALRRQLTHVKLPSLRDDNEYAALVSAVGGMPALEEISIDRGHYYRAPDLPNTSARFVRPAPWPWPRVAGDDERLHVLVPGSRSGDTVTIADAARVMERRFEDLPADVRYAWTRFWVFVDELGKGAWKTDATHAWTADAELPAEILVDALEACDIGGSGGWRELRDELRFRRPLPAGAMVTIHRQRGDT